MEFIGEHLLPGKIGHFLLLLSFVSSLAASFSYIKSVQKRAVLAESQQWKKLARIFFFAEAFSVFAVFGLLYYIVQGHLFEYKYAWQHSSTTLEPKYLLAAIWEGQEGSFLLWSIWHCVLGLFVIWKEKEWESPVMAVVSFVQFILASMVVGITIFGVQIGSNPFVLLRNTMDAPIFSQPNYLSMIQDGNDLNPLLQNYWMVIHPPVLFLGFASTLIPFAFAVGGLWIKDFTSWTKPALPWSLFSAGVLALGIMMGSAWAYESLTFGGYWAWDPVENASLVPWLVLVGGVHGLLIYRHSGNALRTTSLFLILSFLLVLYSTYLTRSGDLQDTSVHAFTGEGITRTHLQILLGSLAIPSLFIFFRRYKSIPFIAKEEEVSSREFWMFVGSLVLFLSGLSIILMTSVPVINRIASIFVSDSKLFTPLAFGEDTAFAYNRIQVFVAIIIGLLTGFTMYLKYKQTGKDSIRKIWLPALVSLVIGVLVVWLGDVTYTEKGAGYLAAVWLAVVAAIYAAIANAAYIWTGMKGSMKRSGGALAHLGFALMLVGILVSSSKKEVLSMNTSGIYINFGEGSSEKSGENLTLIRGIRNDMGKYWVTYEKDSAHPEKPLWFYHIRFENKKDTTENFVLTPNAFVNYKGNEGLMANPSSKHYLDHDVFTYITSLPDPDKNKDTSSFQPKEMVVGDTVFYSKGFAILQDIENHRDIPGAGLTEQDSVSLAVLKVFAKTGSEYTVKPVLIEKGGARLAEPDTLVAESLVLQLQAVKGNKATVGFKESNSVMQYVTLKAYKFPFINLLWLGTIIMVVGFLIAMMRRIETNKVSLKKI